MAQASTLCAAMRAGKYDRLLARLYGADAVAAQRARYADAADAFIARYGDREACFLSAPGRTELGGNHTDHNRGCILAASVNLDVIAVAARAEDTLSVTSAGFGIDTVAVGDWEPVVKERGRSVSLLRGVAARLAALGYTVGGAVMYTTSDVLQGSGLSSSAAYEVLLGTALSALYNGGNIPPVTVAQAAQYAENVYFGKPCGLMDQTASAVGGIVSIDFADPAAPVITQVPFAFEASGYTLCIVDTGGSHANLTADYAAVPAEMEAVARELGVRYLRETDRAAVLAALPSLRARCGDRAVLRALHFFEENRRVAEQTAALTAGDMDAFLRLVVASGRSSFDYLQNVWTPQNPREQGLSLALALAESLLSADGGWRVHGGGFAGTTQNFVPHAAVPAFEAAMNAAFGEGACISLRIREVGGICLDAALTKGGC